MKIELQRGRAGYYSGTVAGRKVEVEYTETAYGDKGWYAWVDGENIADYPRTTKREALGLVAEYVAVRA